jgi:SsrA-binding protein
MTKPSSNLITHRRAHFDYEILKDFEAGLMLVGTEVKSLRGGQGKLEGAHVIIRGSEAFLVGMEIPPYQQVLQNQGYDPRRVRKLLLNKRELYDIEKELQTKGLTVVPLAVYNNGRNIKIKIAIVRGKKAHDKRESIKKREADRDIARAASNNW